MSRSFSRMAPRGAEAMHVDGALADLALGTRWMTFQELAALVPHLCGCERCQVALALLLSAQARDESLEEGERMAIEAARDELLALIRAHDAAAHDEETRAAYAETLVARGEATARARFPALARHLDRCPACRGEIAELRVLLADMMAAGIVAPITPRERPPAAPSRSDERVIGLPRPAALAGPPPPDHSPTPPGDIHMQRSHTTATTTSLPPIEVGTRLTDYATLDLRVQGMA